MYWFKLWFENLPSIYPSMVLANNWPAMVPTKWVAQHYCSKWHVSQGRGLLQIKICPHHFCDEMTNNFWFSLHWEGGEAMLGKNWKIWRKKRRRPHVGNCAETTENPPPPQGFLLHPFTWPAVGTYGTWGCFAPPSPPSLIHQTRQTRSAGHLAAPIQREASRHWQTAKQASNPRPCVLILKDLMDT